MAKRLTTTPPRSTTSRASFFALWTPTGEALRLPTMETRGRSFRISARPATNNFLGAYFCSTSLSWPSSSLAVTSTGCFIVPTVLLRIHNLCHFENDYQNCTGEANQQSIWPVPRTGVDWSKVKKGDQL